MASWFIAWFYQPLLNALVFFYWLIGQTPIGFDMGIAVIMLTILIRIILIPMTITAHRGEKDRREIQLEVANLKRIYSHDPVAQKNAIKKALRTRPSVVISEGVMFAVQVAIALILWRIFARGLSGEDLYMIYQWMPEVSQPFNLVFMGRFDLTHPDLILNIVQTLLIVAVEVMATLTSPYPVSQRDAVRVQVVLPIVSFIIFAFLPAGKKLFVISTLAISLLIEVALLIYRTYTNIFYPKDLTEPEPSVAGDVLSTVSAIGENGEPLVVVPLSRVKPAEHKDDDHSE